MLHQSGDVAQRVPKGFKLVNLKRSDRYYVKYKSDLCKSLSQPLKRTSFYPGAGQSHRGERLGGHYSLGGQPVSQSGPPLY